MIDAPYTRLRLLPVPGRATRHVVSPAWSIELEAGGQAGIRLALFNPERESWPREHSIPLEISGASIPAGQAQAFWVVWPSGASPATELELTVWHVPDALYRRETGASSGGGAVSVTNLLNPHPISAAALPLPAGASTAAKQDVVAALLAAINADQLPDGHAVAVSNLLNPHPVSLAASTIVGGLPIFPTQLAPPYLYVHDQGVGVAPGVSLTHEPSAVTSYDIGGSPAIGVLTKKQNGMRVVAHFSASGLAIGGNTGVALLSDHGAGGAFSMVDGKRWGGVSWMPTSEGFCYFDWAGFPGQIRFELVGGNLGWTYSYSVIALYW